MALRGLNEYFLPKRSTTDERHIFRGMRQEENEKMGDYIMRLRHQAAFCEFGSQTNENIKDQIIEKCGSVALRRRILERGDLTLSEVETLAAPFEAVEEQEKAFRGQDERPAARTFDTAVNTISDRKRSVNGRRGWSSDRNYGRSWDRWDSGNGSQRNEKLEKCSECGRKGHRDDSECPAKEKKCFRCDAIGHFSSVCKSKWVSAGHDRRTAPKIFIRPVQNIHK